MPKAELDPVKVLLIGPLPIPGDHIGGTKVSFQQMVNDVRELACADFRIINLSRPLRSAGWLKRRLINLSSWIRVLKKTWQLGTWADVWALNASPKGAFGLLPAIWLLSKILRRPVIIRLFGGSFGDDFNASSRLNQWIFRKAARNCSTLALQTRALVDQFSTMGNVRWFPTTRNINTKNVTNEKATNFLFLSQIRSEKGANLLLDAASSLEEPFSVDFFGSPFDSDIVSRISSIPTAKYGGELSPSQVPLVVQRYDVLIFPTFWHGEGIPGAIIEAFQCGIPVIASNWKQIPELVEDGKNGLLIESKSVESLVAAIKKMMTDYNLYQRLTRGAVETGKNFQSMKWNRTFLEWCAEACDKALVDDGKKTGLAVTNCMNSKKTCAE